MCFISLEWKVSNEESFIVVDISVGFVHLSYYYQWMHKIVSCH